MSFVVGLYSSFLIYQKPHYFFSILVCYSMMTKNVETERLKRYLLMPGGTTIGSCANTLLIPLSATIFALAIGSMMSSVVNLSKSEEKEFQLLISIGHRHQVKRETTVFTLIWKEII